MEYLQEISSVIHKRTKISMVNVAYIISHPIQHFCPMFAEWTKIEHIKLRVFFASSAGMNSYFDPAFAKEIQWSGLRLEEFDSHFLNRGGNLPIDNNIDAPDLPFELENFKPDVIIVLGYVQKLQKRAMKWAVAKKVKIFLFSDAENRSYRSPLKLILKFFYLRDYFKRVDGFLVTGNANEEYYRLYGGEARKMFRSTFPINIQLYERAYEEYEILRSEIRDKLNIGKESIVCTVVGKLVKRKCQRHLIEALKFIKSKKVVVIVIGSGETEEELIKLSHKFDTHQVILTGFVAADKLPGFYAATDIYVHPALVEPHSLAISEAIYMKCAAIISDTTGSYGTNDDVRIGVNGFVYTHGKIEELAKYIDILSHDVGLLNDFKNESRTYSLYSQSFANQKGLTAALRGIGLLECI